LVRRLISAGWDRYVSTIEAGEEKLRKQERQTKYLHQKLSQYRAPLIQLQIQYNQNKGKVYTEEEDRFLLVNLDKFGLHHPDLYERIREEIRESPLFRFDWFFLSRTTTEIQRRCTTLLTMIMREYGEGEKRALEEDDSRESTPAAKKIKKAGNKLVESLKVRSPFSRQVADGSISRVRV
jgi:SWI/SNF-related matrix-associated actin-dependent regulator of chromatin subfamily A member 5